MNELLSFNDIPVRMDAEAATVWLNQKNIARLFGKERSVITKHIENVLEEGELLRDSTCANFQQVQFEGEREVTREVEHYNLKMVIAVAYRVKSEVGTRFRIWATEQLNDILLGQKAAHGGGEPVAERDKLWRLVESAKSEKVQLTALAALGYHPPGGGPSRLKAELRAPSAAPAIPAEEFFAAWLRALRAGRLPEPGRWLKAKQDRLCVEVNRVLKAVRAEAWAAHRWDRPAVRRGLLAHPAWRPAFAGPSGSGDRVRFEGRDRQQYYWCFVEESLPPELRAALLL